MHKYERKHHLPTGRFFCGVIIFEKANMNKEKRKYWDSQASMWLNHEPFGDLRSDVGEFVRQSVRPFIIELPRSSTVLDLGAGTNNHWYFNSHYTSRPDFQIISLDLSKKMLKLNQAELKIQADIGQPLPIRSNSVEFCTSFFVMRYLTEHEQYSLLEEMKRILKPSSWFLIIDLLKNQWKYQRSIFDPVDLAEHTGQLGYETVSGEIQKCRLSKYIATGFGGWEESVICPFGVLMGMKR